MDAIEKGVPRKCDICWELYVPGHRFDNTCSSECAQEDEQNERERFMEERDRAFDAFMDEYGGGY